MTTASARYAARNSHVAGFDLLGDLLADIIETFSPDEYERFNVIRTKFTEQRQPIPRYTRVLVYKRDNFCCRWCGSASRLELDHIVPWSAGGNDDIDNLRTLCHNCNTYRSNHRIPLDLACRQIPSGYQCVYCAYDEIAEDELRPIFCVTCQHKAAGLRSSTTPLPGWEAVA